MLDRQRRPWRPQLTRAEMGRGWVFFALYVLLFPWVMGWVQRSFDGELPIAESNVVYYLLSATLVFLVFWTFLRHGFHLLLDWLPENLFAFGTGLVGWAVLAFLAGLVPLPVKNPNLLSYPEQFALAPFATGMILIVLMPLVEEPLFRGLLFGTSRKYSRVLGYLLSVFLYAFYCVWQFVYAYGVVDFRYLLLFVEYLPMALALTWCYDNGGSIWSPIALHMVINALTLARTVGG
ncbi:CPBP family intramembrane glutamic endopeptidase [uncultured Flavonifractor sp.]|uniref:CPBP family intramembrane glutamic endopeptidase n=1 Tax=uncultured Flavonifractor sp. TaxID=1193534 RepID=UPI00261AFBD2|nr:type II CAAX endopeptidase family protein [uncultured Flavonifractor sp.]